MDSVRVCNELDEVKLELEKIKGEFRIKTALSESLRKANDDQNARYQEMKLQMEKVAKELSMKVEENAEVRHLYEEVKSRLQETEVSLKHASLGNQKLRVDCEEKVQRLEVENRKLVSDLDAATLKTNELERQICAFHEEVCGLKANLSESQRKCLEAEQKVEMKKELRVRDDAITKLEEQSMGVQDRLKWKTEQFEHLKDAHKLLQEQFQSSKQEWASEKAALIQEISSLQIRLDTQTRMNENLQTELKTCNQALAHEESRRKALEFQLSESKLCCENALAECRETKSKIENLTMEREEEVASLRNALGMKKADVKEMEYRISHLEQENKELLQTVREFQEAQIGRKKPNPSLPNLRNKLKDLEQAHSRCSVNSQEREAEWNMKMEEMIGRLTRCECDLTSKTEENNQLRMQLEGCQSSIEISGEEVSILLMVLQSEFSAAYSAVLNSKPETDVLKEEGEAKVAVLTKREVERKSQLKAQVHLGESRMEIESLSKKLESLKTVEDKNTALANELDKCKKMLEESSVFQLQLKEQAAQMDASSRKEIESLSKKLESLKTVEGKNLVLVNELDKRKKMLEESSLCQLHLEEQAALMEASTKMETESLNKKLESLKTAEGKNLVLVNELEKCKKMLEESSVRQHHLKEQSALTEASMRKEIESLNRKLESLKTAEGKNFVLVNELDKCKKMLEESSVCQFHLKEQAALAEDSAKKEIVSLNKKLESLNKKLESLKTAEGENLQLVNELDKCKKMLEESSVCQFRLKERSALMEASFKKEVESLRKKLESLKTTEDKNTLLANELDKCKKELEESSIRQLLLKEQAALIDDSAKKEIESLSKKLESLRSVENKNTSLANELEKCKKMLEESSVCTLRLKEHATQMEASATETRTALIDLQKEKSWLEQDCKRRESLAVDLATSEVEKFKQAVEKLNVIAEGKDQCIRDLQGNVSMLEQNLMDAIVSSCSETFELLIKTGALGEALQKTEYLIALEVQEKKILVSDLEKEIADLHARIVHNEESLLSSQKRGKEFKASLEYKTREVDSLKDKLGSWESNYKKVEKELELTKQALTEDVRKLSHERDGLIAYFGRVCEKLEEFCEDDAKLMSMLGSCGKNGQKEDIKIDVSLNTITKDLEGNLDRRSPLRVLNQ